MFTQKNLNKFSQKYLPTKKLTTVPASDSKDAESEEDYYPTTQAAIITAILQERTKQKISKNPGKKPQITNQYIKNIVNTKFLNELNDVKDSDSEYEITKEDAKQEINDIIEDIEDEKKNQKQITNDKLTKEQIIDALCDEYYNKTGDELNINVIQGFFNKLDMKLDGCLFSVSSGVGDECDMKDVDGGCGVLDGDVLECVKMQAKLDQEVLANDVMDTFEEVNGRLPTLDELKDVFKNMQIGMADENDKDISCQYFKDKDFTETQAQFAMAAIKYPFDDETVLEMAKKVVFENQQNKAFYEFASKTNRSPGVNELNKYCQESIKKVLNDYASDTEININEIIEEKEEIYSDDSDWVRNDEENIKNLLKRNELKINIIKNESNTNTNKKIFVSPAVKKKTSSRIDYYIGSPNKLNNDKAEHAIENVAGYELTKDERNLLNSFLEKPKTFQVLVNDVVIEDDENDADYNPESDKDDVYKRDVVDDREMHKFVDVDNDDIEIKEDK